MALYFFIYIHNLSFTIDCPTYLIIAFSSQSAFFTQPLPPILFFRSHSFRMGDKGFSVIAPNFGMNSLITFANFSYISFYKRSLKPHLIIFILFIHFFYLHLLFAKTLARALKEPLIT